MKPFRNKNRAVSLCIVALMVAGYAVWMFCTGDLSDDLWYRHELEPDTTSRLVVCNGDTITQDYAWCKGKPVTEWSQVFSSCGRHYLHHGNGRLPNMLIYLQNMIPSWVIDLALTLMMAVMAVMLLRLALPSWRERPLATVLILWSVWIVLPWDDQMASTVYMMNYVWTAALNLWLLWKLYAARTPRSRYGWGTCLLAAVAAVMHEGFSLPMCAGLLVLLLQTPKQQRRCLIAPAVIYWVFSLYVIFPPATIQRFIGATAADKGDLLSREFMYRFLVKTYMIALTLCVVLWYGLRRGWKRLRTRLLELLPLETIALVSLAMGLVLRFGGRVIWPAIIMMLIICWRLLTDPKKEQKSGNTRRKTKSRPGNAAVALLLGILLCCWLCALGAWQYRADREMDRIADAMKASGTDLVYINTTQRGDIPWWLLEIPEFYHTAHPTVKGAHYASQRQKEYFGLITMPEKFRDIPLDSLPPVPGNSGFRGEYPFYYSPRFIGNDLFASFSLGPIPFRPLNGPSAPPYLLFAKLRDLKAHGNPVVHTYSLTAYPVVPADSDTLWFYVPGKFAASDLGRPILSVNIDN